MDRKTRHEEFVTGHNGGSVSQIYTLSAACLLSQVCYESVAAHVPAGAPRLIADFLFNWTVPLVAMTIYAQKLYLLAAILVITLALTLLAGSENKAAKPAKNNGKRTKPTKSSAEPPAKVAYRGFVTLYRSQMMILTITAILAVDFPIFPRSFSKTETWGTSLMDLGVGSFVFSMGIVTSRKAYKEAGIKLIDEVKQSIYQTLKILALGIIRLASVKMLDYQEHVSEYGVHWNFFFTIGLLPLAFTFFNRIPFPGGQMAKSFVLAFGYEITLKNTELQHWALWAARTSLLSQNKEGVVSFVGYLAIFSFGYSIGTQLMNPSAQFQQMIKTLVKWSSITQVLFLILRIETEPSRRIVNLPYITWTVSYNAGCLAVMAALEYFLGVAPSSSLEAVNKHGELVFVLGNLSTGIVNMMVDTLDIKSIMSLAVLVAYQGFMAITALYLNK